MNLQRVNINNIEANLIIYLLHQLVARIMVET